MNVGSLFAGIGGFDLGLERAGMRTVWQVELEPYRRAVLAKHFPDAERFVDVRDVGARNLEPVDVICGGFPCQDLSLAGRREGIDGSRSGLWAEFHRIICELRPRFIIVENVAALLVGGGIGRVLGDMAASGYDAEWDCIPASAVGAPHRRDRIWIVAYPQRQGLAIGQRVGGDPREKRETAERGGRSGGPPGLEDLADAEGHALGAGLCEGEPATERGRRSANGGGAGDIPDSLPVGCDGRQNDKGQTPAERVGNPQTGWWAAEPNVGRVAYGIPNRVDRLAALGDSLVPQIAEWIGRRIIESEGA